MASIIVAPPMPAGQVDQIAWTDAYSKGWIVNKNLPLTVFSFPEKVTLSAPCDSGTTCTFSRKMVACPLTINGPAGSAPDGKANWWTSYFSNKVASHGKAAWVQGHLLNHNIHGPGVSENLVPITYDLNGTMSAWAEEVIKKEILNKGKLLAYQVTAHWEGGKKVGSDSDWPGNAARHPAAMCAVLDGHKKGECLAPTFLHWEAWEIAWNGTGWAIGTAVPFRGYGGIENGIFPNSWNS